MEDLCRFTKLLSVILFYQILFYANGTVLSKYPYSLKLTFNDDSSIWKTRNITWFWEIVWWVLRGNFVLKKCLSEPVSSYDKKK